MEQSVKTVGFEKHINTSEPSEEGRKKRILKD